MGPVSASKRPRKAPGRRSSAKVAGAAGVAQGPSGAFTFTFRIPLELKSAGYGGPDDAPWGLLRHWTPPPDPLEHSDGFGRFLLEVYTGARFLNFLPGTP